MQPPSGVKAYFEADKGDDADAWLGYFPAEAVVEDEGARYKGVDAIRAWWLAAKRKYHHVAEPIESSGAGNEVSVRAKVSGQFPNSPATLEFLFTVDNGEIVALRIG
ncbi:MAG: nuclear transport factor 2 family protein [Gammaproteobacteria bacterium]